MSIIRQLARGYRPRFPSARCSFCHKRIYVFEYFCPYCGQRNSEFDANAFERIAKSTLAEAQIHCSVGRTHRIEAVAYATDRELRRWLGSHVHCTICGEPLAVDHPL